jgi:hypothetical protein
MNVLETTAQQAAVAYFKSLFWPFFGLRKCKKTTARWWAVENKSLLCPTDVLAARSCYVSEDIQLESCFVLQSSACVLLGNDDVTPLVMPEVLLQVIMVWTQL